MILSNELLIVDRISIQNKEIILVIEIDTESKSSSANYTFINQDRPERFVNNPVKNILLNLCKNQIDLR